MLKRWHITITCCFALFMPTVVNAQGVTTWQETTHDFGTFHESEGKKSCAFVFTNSGDSSIVVLRVQSTCGCTVANYPTKAIAPGEKDSITATFTPTGRPGPFEKDVWVSTNTSPNRTRLTIKGVVVGSPESVSRYFPVSAGALQFTTLSMAAGDVKKGLLRNSTVTAYNTSTDTIVITFDNNFDATIVLNGMKIKYTSLSKGQRSRVDFAAIVSFVKFLKLQFGELNLLFLDELFSHVDISGMNDMIDILRSLSTDMKLNIYLIHHAPLQNIMFDKVLQTKMTDGFSRIEYL